MLKRGAKAKGRVLLEWSPNFAYAVGLLVTDGSLSKNGRGITMTSKDVEQIKNFMEALSISIPIGKTVSGATGRSTPRIQLSDTLFYTFLISIGVTSNKSKTISRVKIPDEYFFDFLRGHFDGDGTVYCYWDKRWKSSFLCYTSFTSASVSHIKWLQDEILERTELKGHVSKAANSSVYQLRYATSDSQMLWKYLYPTPAVLALSRKRLKIQRIMRIILERQGGKVNS